MSYAMELIGRKEFLTNSLETIKRIFFVAFVYTLCCQTMLAQPRSEAEALEIARTFLTGNDASHRVQTKNSPQIVMVPTLQLSSKVRPIGASRHAPASGAVGLYVFNDEANERFVIVSGDKRQIETLGDSDNGIFDAERIPCGLLTFLEQYAAEYDYLQMRVRWQAAGHIQALVR